MVSHINNGELGLSVRTKLNSVIDLVNATGSLPNVNFVYLVDNATDQAWKQDIERGKCCRG